MWYVLGLENPAADIDSEIATRTIPFMVPLVENCGSPEEESVDEFLHVLEDSFSYDEVWIQPYDLQYVLLRNAGSVGKDVNADAGPAPQFDTEPADGPEELEPLSTDEVVTEDLREPAACLDNAGKKISDQSTDPDDAPKLDTDRPL